MNFYQKDIPKKTVTTMQRHKNKKITNKKAGKGKKFYKYTSEWKSSEKNSYMKT